MKITEEEHRVYMSYEKNEEYIHKVKKLNELRESYKLFVKQNVKIEIRLRGIKLNNSNIRKLLKWGGEDNVLHYLYSQSEDDENEWFVKNEEQIKSYCSTKINNNPNIDRTHNEQIQRDVCYKVVDELRESKIDDWFSQNN